MDLSRLSTRRDGGRDENAAPCIRYVAFSIPGARGGVRTHYRSASFPATIPPRVMICRTRAQFASMANHALGAGDGRCDGIKRGMLRVIWAVMGRQCQDRRRIPGCCSSSTII